MASLSPTSEEGSASLKKGEYQPSTGSDLRSPCPVVNAFANHGLIPRDGRNVRGEELDAAMKELGLSITIRKTLIWGAFLERYHKRPSGVWDFVRSPLAYVHWHFGIRDIDQTDSNSIPCLNLDQLSRHGAIEHDGSLTRRDFAQGDNCSAQEDLVAQLSQSSTDGIYITTSDFARLRRKRLEQQRNDNPDLCFPSLLHFVTAGEVAATQRVFGHSDKEYRIPVSYVEALFREERLPIKEGWQRRQGWLVGMLGVVIQLLRVRVGIGRIGSQGKAS
ncbi:MAG: hypothetical protein Q9166_002104 [cf. Caloplaca sp. 2 TL-2023]